MTVNQTVEPGKMSRKARFRGALGLASMTAREWATEHGIAEAHLSRVLNGKVTSQPLLAKIDAFIAKQFEENSAAPTSAASTPTAA